jgi:hypothetical protein
MDYFLFFFQINEAKPLRVKNHLIPFPKSPGLYGKSPIKGFIFNIGMSF